MRKDWRYCKIGDICTVARGGSPRPIEDYLTSDPDGINWIKIGDAQEGSKYITSTAQRIRPDGAKKSRFVRKGDFILSNSMSFGRPYILGIDGCIHDGWLVLQDNDSVFNKSFLYYYLSSPSVYAEFKRLAVGGVVNNLNSNLVKSVLVPVPSLREQEEIVADLDRAATILNLHKEQLQEVDKLPLAFFYKSFGNPVSNPNGWESIPLSGVSTLITDGSHYSPKDEEMGTIPMLSVKNMGARGFDYTDCKMISQEEYKKLEASGCKPMPDDVLVAKDGSYFKKIFVHQSEAPQAILSSIAIVRPDQTKVTPEFLCSLLSTPDIYNLVEERYLTGTAIKRVILKGLRQLKIIVPPMDMQKQFSMKIWRINAQRRLIEESVVEAQKLFDSRMNYYFGD